MNLVFLFGLAVAIAGFTALQIIASKYKPYTFPALMLFLVGTEPLGYLLWGEPAGSIYFNGWLLGLVPCIIFGFWSRHRKTKQ
jgi:hypothetical protein